MRPRRAHPRPSPPPQRSLEFEACCPAVEDEAQRSAAQLVQAGVSPVGPAAALPRVDVDALELVRPRSVGVEHVALWAMRQLRPPSLLEQLGLSGAQRAAVLGNLVGRMAAPASAHAAWHWLRQRSALGEPLGCDCETMGRNAPHRASDRLLRHRDTIETRLLQRAAALFDLQPTVTLHDRTSTCLEGAAERQPLARRGHSREKRHDCPPLTLGLVLDASGFARRSRVLAGNVAEGGTLQARHPSAAPHYAIDGQADDRGRNATAVAWKRQPLEGSGATHPGVHGLRTNSIGWDAERLWRTYVTLTDLEAVLRSLGSALGPRPLHHRKPARSAGHRFLSVLACQLVQVVRQRLRAGGETARWTTLRRRLAGQRRVTAVFRQADGRMLHVRKATRAESWQRAIYERPGVDASPGGVRSWSSSLDAEGKMHGM